MLAIQNHRESFVYLTLPIMKIFEMYVSESQKTTFWAIFGLFMPGLCQLGALCQTYGTIHY